MIQCSIRLCSRRLLASYFPSTKFSPLKLVGNVSVSDPPHRTLLVKSCSSMQNVDNSGNKVTSKMDEILELANSRPKFYATNACEVLSLLANQSQESASEAFKEALKTMEDKSDVQAKDDNIKHLNKIIEVLQLGKHETVATKSLMSALKSLTLLNVPPTTFVVQNIENALTWRARSCSMNDLALLLSFTIKRKKHSDEAKKLFAEIIRAIEMRWVEVEDAKTISSIIHYGEVFSEKFLAKLEDRLIEFAENMSTEDIVAVLRVMSIKKRRSLPLLKALGYHLARKRDLTDLKMVSDSLFAVNQLAFKDQDLLESLCVNGVNALETFSPDEPNSAAVRSLITSLGQIGFCHRDLLNRITVWFKSRLTLQQNLDNRDLVAYLLTTATLNYLPSDSEPIYQIIVDNLTRDSLSDESKKSELLWLTVVWSLTVIGKVQSHHFESVLSAEFFQRLLYVHDHRNVGVLLKLLNVNAAAEYLHTDYKGPILDLRQETILMNVHATKSVDRMKLSANIFDTIHALASPPNFLQKEINTWMGFHIDAEAVFEVNTTKPVGSIQEMALLGRQMFPDSELPPVKDVPEGAKRLAVMILAFNDCLIGNHSHLSGLTSLCKRLLDARGYSVLLVRHDDLKPSQKKVERVKILEAKLKDSLKR